MFIALKPFLKISSTKKNHSYPENSIIIDHGIKVLWRDIMQSTKLKNYSEIEIALNTYTKSVRDIFQRVDLCNFLEHLVENNNYFIPTSGVFDIFDTINIYNALKILKKSEILISDSFGDSKKTVRVNIDSIDQNDFVKNFNYCSNTIYSQDKEIVFFVQKDCFHYYIGSQQKNIDILTQQDLFEWFLCNENTENEWQYQKGELKRLIDLEKIIITYNHEKKKNYSLEKHTAVAEMRELLEKDIWLLPKIYHLCNFVGIFELDKENFTSDEKSDKDYILEAIKAKIDLYPMTEDCLDHLYNYSENFLEESFLFLENYTYNRNSIILPLITEYYIQTYQTLYSEKYTNMILDLFEKALKKEGEQDKKNILELKQKFENFIRK